MNKPFFIIGLAIFAAAATLPPLLYPFYPPCYTCVGLRALEEPPAIIGAFLVLLAAACVAWSFVSEDIEP